MNKSMKGQFDLIEACLSTLQTEDQVAEHPMDSLDKVFLAVSLYYSHKGDGYSIWREILTEGKRFTGFTLSTRWFP